MVIRASIVLYTLGNVTWIFSEALCGKKWKVEAPQSPISVMYRSSTGISLGQVYLLSLPRLQKRVTSMSHPDSFLSFCGFAFLLLKENIHLLLRFCAESLIYRSHEELLEYALEDECLGGEGGLMPRYLLAK